MSTCGSWLGSLSYLAAIFATLPCWRRFSRPRTASIVTMQHIVRALRREYQKLGKLVTESDFGAYFSLLRPALTWASNCAEIGVYKNATTRGAAMPKPPSSEQRRQAQVQRSKRAERVQGSADTPQHPLLDLQRTVGNAQIANMLAQREAMPGKRKRTASFRRCRKLAWRAARSAMLLQAGINASRGGGAAAAYASNGAAAWC